jgi:hypothetical protein
MYCRQRRHFHILLWSNLEILFAPLRRSSPLIGGLRCQAIQTEHGPYIAERTQKAAYIVRCLWLDPFLPECCCIDRGGGVIPIHHGIHWDVDTEAHSESWYCS